MKKLFAIILSLVTFITCSGAIRAEENQLLKNITDRDVKNIMQNTVMIRPKAPDAFVFGKKVSLEEYGEVRLEGDKLLVNGGFLRQAFPEKDISDGDVNLYEFADANGMKVEINDGTYYLSDKSYRLPSNISSYVSKFFGIYVKEGAKGTGTFENPV